jgi:hypothetical protein
MRGRGLGAPESLLKHSTSVVANRAWQALILPFSAIPLPPHVLLVSQDSSSQAHVRRLTSAAAASSIQMPSLRRCRHLQGPHHAHC